MEKEKNGKSEIHITNNFNAPIGQHIDHVDTINFRMDGDGNFHFGMVEEVKEDKRQETKKEISDINEPLSMKHRVKRSIEVIADEGVLKHLYDHTWVMEAMNQTDGMPKYNTPSSFISYLRDLGIERLPSEDSIQRKQNVFTGKFPDWEFTDCDSTEANRRINVGKRFLNVYRTM